MPKQVCANHRVNGCVKLVALPERWCESCKAAGAGKDQRPSAAKRMYGPEWRRASAAYLAEHPIAADIFKHHGGVLVAAEVVDHIVPHRGDYALFWDESNWQGLTRRDHSRKTAMEDGAFGNRRKSA